jgi:hypothetical protein
MFSLTVMVGNKAIENLGSRIPSDAAVAEGGTYSSVVVFAMKIGSFGVGKRYDIWQTDEIRAQQRAQLVAWLTDPNFETSQFRRSGGLSMDVWTLVG